jgi:diadenosine tetraphosphate (Ap4A) HIT family hydrolase
VRDLGLALEDGPVAKVTVPQKTDYFALKQAEINALNQLLESQEAELLSLDATIQGFNMGINSGEVAGKAIMHCHVHLIPPREKDVPNPRGGIRHVIPAKGSY